MGDYHANHSILGSPEPMRNMLNEVGLLSPKGKDYIIKQSLIASNVQIVQIAMKLPVSSN